MNNANKSSKELTMLEYAAISALNGYLSNSSVNFATNEYMAQEAISAAKTLLQELDKELMLNKPS